MPEQPFSVVFDDSTSTLTVVGEVDEPHAAALRDAIEQHSGGGSSDLVVDLGQVTYLPSVAVGVVATSRQKLQASGATLDLVAAEGSIAQRVLTVCALSHRTS